MSRRSRRRRLPGWTEVGATEGGVDLALGYGATPFAYIGPDGQVVFAQLGDQPASLDVEATVDRHVEANGFFEQLTRSLRQNLGLPDETETAAAPALCPDHRYMARDEARCAWVCTTAGCGWHLTDEARRRDERTRAQWSGDVARRPQSERPPFRVTMDNYMLQARAAADMPWSQPDADVIGDLRRAIGGGALFTPEMFEIQPGPGDRGEAEFLAQMTGIPLQEPPAGAMSEAEHDAIREQLGLPRLHEDVVNASYGDDGTEQWQEWAEHVFRPDLLEDPDPDDWPNRSHP